MLRCGDVVADGGVARGVTTLGGWGTGAGGVRLGAEPPLEVLSPLSHMVAVWVVGALDVILMIVEALSRGPSC